MGRSGKEFHKQLKQHLESNSIKALQNHQESYSKWYAVYETVGGEQYR